jgi:hypothetical protein
MDQQQWQTTTDLDAMLKFLRLSQDKETKQQMRLFACACVRRVWPLLFDPASLAAVEVAERYAGGQASADDLLAARRVASEVASATGDRAALAAREVTRNESWSAADCAAREAATAAMFSRLQARGGESWSRAAPGSYEAAQQQYRDDERAPGRSRPPSRMPTTTRIWPTPSKSWARTWRQSTAASRCMRGGVMSSTGSHRHSDPNAAVRPPTRTKNEHAPVETTMSPRAKTALDRGTGGSGHRPPVPVPGATLLEA